MTVFALLPLLLWGVLLLAGVFLFVLVVRILLLGIRVLERSLDAPRSRE
ncbi:hypothetical protein [Leucobacter sp. M11]|nr:hypothetical protein [Leucobacter sp. M11]MEB4614582.1 hypothetical protein [Leucobacter sp. M11]